MNSTIHSVIKCHIASKIKYQKKTITFWNQMLRDHKTKVPSISNKFVIYGFCFCYNVEIYNCKGSDLVCFVCVPIQIWSLFIGYKIHGGWNWALA